MKTSWLLAATFGCSISSVQAGSALLMDHMLDSSYLLADAHSAISKHDFVIAETLLKDIAEQNPSNDDAHFWLAKTQAWQGKFDESSVQYQKLLGKAPNNSDYQLGQAQVLVWGGKPKEALPILASAQRLNPTDPDIMRLRIQAHLVIGNAASKGEAAQLTQEAKQLFPQQKWDYVPNSVALNEATSSEQVITQTIVLDVLDHNLINKPSNQVEAGVGYDTLTNGRGHANLEYLDFVHRFAPQKLMYGSLRQTQRFQLNDTQFLLGGYYSLPSGMTLNVEGNFSGTHELVPMNSEMASLQVPISKGWFVTGGLRHSKYTSSTSYQEFGVLEWYVGDYRLAYTLSSTQARGETLFGNRVSLSRYYNDTSYVMLNLGQGREVEQGLNQNIFFNTTSIGLNGRHWFNKDWAMSWSLGSTRQDSAYTRTGGSLGLRRAF
jgi:YaiO family outer membrane protein